MKEAVHASEISEGTFDITFESLHGLWKFDQDLDPHPPTDAQIKAKLPFVGYRHIQLDAGGAHGLPRPERDEDQPRRHRQGLRGRPRREGPPGRGAHVLLRAGRRRPLRAGKKPDGGDWSAGIRDPRGPEGVYFAILPVSDHAFSTAGDYERSYVIDGKRYHHIIDPRTGYPATASRSVTIWAPTAFLADEIDDAVFILGPEKGLKLVESLDGVGAVIVDAHNGVHISKRLEGKLRITAVPTDATVTEPRAQRWRRSVRAASSSSRAQRTSRTAVHFDA